MAQLFTLIQDDIRALDVQMIPLQAMNSIIVPVLRSIDQTQLDNAVNVRVHRCETSGAKPFAAPSRVFTETYIDRPPEVSLGPFIIPQPPPLLGDEVRECQSLSLLPRSVATANIT